MNSWINTKIKIFSARIILKLEILGKIVLDSRYDRLNEFQEYYQIHINFDISTTFHHSVDQFFHNLSVPKIKKHIFCLKFDYQVLHDKLTMHYLQGWTDAMGGPGMCGWDSIVTVFLAWSWLTSSYICSTVRGLWFWWKQSLQNYKKITLCKSYFKTPKCDFSTSSYPKIHNLGVW